MKIAIINFTRNNFEFKDVSKHFFSLLHSKYISLEKKKLYSTFSYYKIVVITTLVTIEIRDKLFLTPEIRS